MHMKNFLLLIFLFAAASVQAQEKQSLKDLLYGGKLKNDSSGVIRSTDDLSSKIDTTTKKTPPPAPPVAAPAPKENTMVQPAGNVSGTPVKDAVETTSLPAAPAPPAAAAPSKTNTRLWKEYNDTLTKILKAEVL